MTMTMSANPKYTNIARPYALAAFEYAREKNTLDTWKSFLEASARVANDKQVARLLSNPEISTASVFDLFSEILASVTDEEQKNYLRLLAQNRRLMLLANISELFNAYYAKLEKISKVRLVTAIDIEDAYKQQLSQALAKRIQHHVTLQCDVNPSILGGAIIHIGDKVIDGSIRGKLNRLLNNLTG